MNDPKNIEMLRDYQFNELDDWVMIPRGTVFEVQYWQGINGERCPIVNGLPFVNSEIYFTVGEWKPTDRTKAKSSKEAYKQLAYQGVD